jgi:hypothetical protein
LTLGVAATLAPGQSSSTFTFNEREIKSESKSDVGGIWTLDFRFKDPRLIKVNVPARGTRICWYLWYQVINRTKEPHSFIPDFEIVTIDKPGVYRDEVLPTVEEAINKLENPTRADYLKPKNSVTIAKDPIPVSEPEAFPKAITGVAIWDDTTPEQYLRSSTRYSIFVSGLSNGWVLTDNEKIVRRKTLQLNFKRLGDRFSTDSRDISFVSPHEWIYRGSPLVLPKGAKGGAEKAGAVSRPPLDKSLIASK